MLHHRALRLSVPFVWLLALPVGLADCGGDGGGTPAGDTAAPHDTPAAPDGGGAGDSDAAGQPDLPADVGPRADGHATDAAPLPDASGDVALPDGAPGPDLARPDAPTGDAAADVPPVDVGPPPPPPLCLTADEGPYPLEFVDVTEQLGLGRDALRITGSNVTVADIDGDDWPDITLTKGSAEAEDPAAPRGLYRLLRNTGGAGFEDVTFTSGLFAKRDGTLGRPTTFVLYGDVDNDGDVDAFSAFYQDENQLQSAELSSIFLNEGNGRFVRGPDQSFTSGYCDPVSGAAFLDYDRDGLLDLYVGHHYGRYGYLNTMIQDALLRGDGAGTFADVTTPAGLETFPFSEARAADGTSHSATWGVTACDVDGDGWTDLMAGNYGRAFNRFYRNVAGTFENLSFSSGFAADSNLDYHDNLQYQCWCEVHTDDAACLDAPPPPFRCDAAFRNWTPGVDDQPWRLGGNSSNTVCGDVDNDGDLDLLAVELAHDWAGQSSDRTELLLNEGFPETPFVRPGNAATGLDRGNDGYGWNEGDLGAVMADFDNDGRLDIYLAESDYPSTWSHLFHAQADGTYVDRAYAADARVFRAHGIGLIDFDRDGDYDLVVGTSLMRWEQGDYPPKPDDVYAYVLRNEVGQDANKLMFQLLGGPGTNRGAVGARITVRAGGRTFVREVQGGYGLTGFEQDPLQIVGIGATCVADEVVVRWPDATLDETRLTGVPANYVLRIEQGRAPTYLTLAEFRAR